jgi:signal transduction histidine kinase
MSEKEPLAVTQTFDHIKQEKANEFQFTLKALTHLVNQTTTELDTVNNSLERKVIEKTEALQSKVEELELATRVKSDFLANMSHEIRTPLNAILGFIQLLGRNETDKTRVKQFATVKSAGNSLVTIINDILDFSKIESGKLELEKRRFYTKKPFKDVSLLFAQKANEEGIQLTFSFDKALPRFSVGDELRIKQILSNLLSNAIKFTPELGSINVKVSLDDKDNTLVCSVCDTGKGISPSNQKHIFEAFSQADSSTTREYGGTGLGLSITWKLLQLMNGSISLESSLKRGSTFTFTIPLFDQLDINGIEVIKEESEVLKKDVLLTGKVLLVEDNRANQMLMKIFLGDMGLEIVLAVDGKRAYDMYRKEMFDLILMDENMPVMNGVESTRHIRQYEQENKLKKTPIIAVTANVLLGDKEKFLRAGMDDYVAKPIDVDQLKATISRYL